MTRDKALEITPLISLSYCMYYARHTKEDYTEEGGYIKGGEYKHRSLGGKIVTKCWDVLTILVGTIEGPARGALGIIGAIFLAIGYFITGIKGKEVPILQLVVGDILCNGALASAEAICLSSGSLVKVKC